MKNLNLLKKKTVKKVKDFLNKFDKNIELIILDDTARTAKDASKVLKQNVGAIVKSLLFKDEIKNKFYLCLISGDKLMSLKKIVLYCFLTFSNFAFIFQ